MNPYQTILLVEDDETTNFLHRRLLNRMAAADNIAQAGNGEEAINYLRTHAAGPGHTPLLILLDIKMPVMDGFEFLEAFEKLTNELNPDIRVIMLSSSVSPVDLARMKKFPSVSGYYSKPLSEEIVQKIMAEKLR
jgi:CheY-like chemotaxis protein